MPPLAGDIQEESIPTLNFIVSLLKAREPLAQLLEAAAEISAWLPSGEPNEDGYQLWAAARDVARAVLGEEAECQSADSEVAQ